ncbi:MAG: helix-turn-helix domain-containing protein [Thermoleophilia bacterium]
MTVTVGDFGLFFVGRYQKDAFDAEDRVILELAAEGAETALDSALLRASLSASKEEVTALGDVGKQVSALACPPDVLSLVCQKAATLLAADAAYVALASSDGMDFRMDTWYGIRSPRWHEITVKFGRGLGGRVGKLRSGITMGEPAEWQGSLEPAVEELIRTEGIQTVVCVPLMAGDDILGVLYAANRSAVRFTPGQGRLLQALADQAAIALANSRLYEEQRRELEVHDLLASVLLSDGDYGSVARALHGLIGNPVALYDRHLNLIAHYPNDLPERLRGEIEQLKDRVRSASGPLEVLVARLRSTRKGVLVPSLLEDGLAVSRVIAPAVAGTDLLGYVHFLEVDRAFEPADIRLAERASVLLALHVMRGRVAAEVEQRLRGSLLGDLLSDNAQTAEACVRRSAHLGYDLTGAQVVLVVDIVDFGESMRQRGWDEAKAIDLRRRLFEQVALGLRNAGVEALVDLKNDRVVGIVGCGPGDEGYARFSARIGEALLEQLERHLPDLQIVVGVG